MANEFVARNGVISLGGVTFPHTLVSSTYSILPTDYLIEASTGTFTVTLPTAVGIEGKIYIVKNSGTGVITVATTSSQTMDGVLTYALAQKEALQLTSTGTAWAVLNLGSSGTASFNEASLGNGLHWQNAKLEASLGHTLTFESGAINSSIWDISTNNQTVFLKDPSDNLQLTYIEMQQDGGALLLVDMPIVSHTFAAEESYEMQIDGSSALKIYGLGSGTALSETGIVVETTYFSLGDPQTNGSWRLMVDSNGFLSIQKRVSGNWIEKGHFE